VVVGVRIDKAILAGAAAFLIAAVASCARAQTADLRGTVDPRDSADSRSNDSDPDQAFPALAPPGTPNAETVPPPIAGTPESGMASDPSGMINYGKPKPKKPKLYQLYKPNPKTSPPLPALVPYETAPAPSLRRKSRSATPNDPVISDPNLADPDAQSQQLPAPTVAVLPPLPKARKLPQADPDPFAPTGIDAGSLRLFPYVEADTGFDTNPNRLSSEVKSSAYVHTEAGLRLESNWSQNSLTANLRGGYADYFSYSQADRPDASGNIVGRVDVTRETQIDSETRFNLTTQQPGSPQLAVPGSTFITNRPLIASYGETFGLTQYFNRWQFGLHGSFDRLNYGDATQSDGTTLALSSENYNEYGLQGRLGYELRPGLLPYIQLRGDIRHHDDDVDFDGFDRNSDGIAFKGGSQFDFVGLFKGDISAGYASRTYADARLPKLAAPTVDGSLAYSITPLTTITLLTGTDLSETTNPFTSGAISRHVSLQITHALTRQLTLTATGTYQNDLYVGQPTIRDNYYTAVLGVEYKLNRDLVLLGNYRYERMLTTFPNANFAANVFLFGLRLQR
jgi:hypothetical protein